jgi:hypothetical protein
MFYRLIFSAFIVAAWLPIPAVTHAQLGRLIKQKATEKVAGKAAEKAGLQTGPAAKEPPERYTEETIGRELDEKTLEAVFRGLAVVHSEYAALQAERARLRKRSEELQPTAAALDSVRRSRTEEVEQCRTQYLNDFAMKRQAQMARSLMRPSQNPDTIRLIMALTDSITAAHQRGDTTRVQRLTLRTMGITYGIDLDAAAGAAEKTCGTVPERSAVSIEFERIGAQMDSLVAVEREMHQRVMPKAAAASGLPLQRLLLARERILTWYSWHKGDASRWSRREHALFLRRKDEIRRAIGYGE